LELGVEAMNEDLAEFEFEFDTLGKEAEIDIPDVD